MRNATHSWEQLSIWFITDRQIIESNQSDMESTKRAIAMMNVFNYSIRTPFLIGDRTDESCSKRCEFLQFIYFRNLTWLSNIFANIFLTFRVWCRYNQINEILNEKLGARCSHWRPHLFLFIDFLFSTASRFSSPQSSSS